MRRLAAFLTLVAALYTVTAASASASGIDLSEAKSGTFPNRTFVLTLPDRRLITARDVTVEEINTLFKNVAAYHLKGVVEYNDEQIVSHDVVGNPHSCVFDATLTKVMDGRFVKVFGWYDNEWGYSCRVADLAKFLVDRGL